MPRRHESRLRLLDTGSQLSSLFESSVAGLFFVGPAAFGPVLRFACGAKFVAPHQSRYFARTSRSTKR